MGCSLSGILLAIIFPLDIYASPGTFAPPSEEEVLSHRTTFIQDSSGIGPGESIVFAVYEEVSGKLWFGTEGGRWILFDQQSGKFLPVRTDSENPGGLSGAVIRSELTTSLWQAWWFRIPAIVVMLALAFEVYRRLTPGPSRRLWRSGERDDARDSEGSKGSSEMRGAVDHILVVQKDKMIFVPVRQVVYIESVGHYSMIVTPEKSHLTSSKISDFEKKFGHEFFIRSHRCYIVNINFIKDIEVGANGTHRIRLTSGHEIPLSRRRISDLKLRYGIT